MSLDLAGADGGSLALAFGAGCTAAWGFMQRILIGPLKQQLADLKTECRERDAAAQARIDQLQTLLLVHGPGPLRQELQAVISEARVEQGE